jgi:hypothetical protein
MEKYRIVETDSGFIVEGKTDTTETITVKKWWITFSFPIKKKVWRRLTCQGRPHLNTHYLVFPPALPPFKTLKEAKEYLRKKINPKRIIHEP